MLKPAEAQERLKQFRDEHLLAKRLAALGKLSNDLRQIGFGLLEHDTSGHPLQDWQAQQKALSDAHAKMHGLKTEDRRELFKTLCPKIADYLEGCWQLIGRLPYRIGASRRAFRGPDNPEALIAARKQCLYGLESLISRYDQDIIWVALWAGHFSATWGASFGLLLAAAIDAGTDDSQRVFDILLDSGRGEHEIGVMGRHVARALLVASRPEGWEFMEKMLLAAQRQEGLRQVILEIIDEAHPQAFRRMLRLIKDHDLARFSATVRAVNVWFGYQWDSVSVAVVNKTIDQALLLLEDDTACAKALKSNDDNTVHLGLWATAIENAADAIEPAANLLTHKDPAKRYLGVTFLAELSLPGTKAKLLQAVDDKDLRVAVTACHAVAYFHHYERADQSLINSDLFERIERLLKGMPEKAAKLEPLVWPWAIVNPKREQIAKYLVTYLGDRPPTRLLPCMQMMATYDRMTVVFKLGMQEKWDNQTRDTLFALVKDKVGRVSEAALSCLKKCTIKVEEAQHLENLLNRKANDIRRGILAVLLGQMDAKAFASADRLLTASDALQRLAGLELLRLLAEGKRKPEDCRKRADDYRTRRPRLSKDEETQIRVLLDIGRKVPTLDDALGLMNAAERTKPPKPRKLDVKFVTPAAIECLKSLGALVHQHREKQITVETYQGTKEELLANCEWTFPAPNIDVPAEHDAKRLPLREIWQTWLEGRPETQRDPDGMELVRAHTLLRFRAAEAKEVAKNHPEWKVPAAALIGDIGECQIMYGPMVGNIIQWFLRDAKPRILTQFLLDAVEATYAMVPAQSLTPKVNQIGFVSSNDDWREVSLFGVWNETLVFLDRRCKLDWNDEQKVRYWRLSAWRDEPGPGFRRLRPDFSLVFRAFGRDGGFTEADLLDHLLGPSKMEALVNQRQFDSLGLLTQRNEPELLKANPALKNLVDRCRARIVEIELERGETPTAASQPALAIRSLYGVDLLIRLLSALGEKPFTRGYNYNRGLGKDQVLTHLVEVTYAAEGETVETFAAAVKKIELSTERLIELAFTAPQWVPHVEHAIAWPSFGEGVWWFIAHTRGGDSGLDWESWKTFIKERTPLTVNDLHEGAVDVAWFHRVYTALGHKRWLALREAAKYGAAAQGHKRALFLSDVMLGKAKKADIVNSVKVKRARESVRALGLLPLASGIGRERDLLDRYRILQEYTRYARQLSAMTKEGALRGAQIGMENLARTAGYPDPIRLEWAMEARAVADLAKGPVSAIVHGVTVSLALVGEGEPELSVAKKGKPLKSIPAELKKNAKVAHLVQRRTDLKRQASRMRLSLESAMCRGDLFTGEELRQLFEHPVLAPQLGRLVLIGEGIIGYPVSRGKGLRDYAGKIEPIKKSEKLRIAHPHDLLQTKHWHNWQHDLFAREAVQPFKQVYRELYVVTKQEKTNGGTLSRRYAGHQINPSQATALWGSRGWTVSQEDGVRRTYHDEAISVYVGFQFTAFTPAEVEGWTLEAIVFHKRDELKPMPLAKVPARLFSEAMRDLDLVVSVAHRGGVDPEASASTVEMRASLLRETCKLLKLENVRIKNSHVMIDGSLSHYSVHLGSAIVHRQPGGFVGIVPVHAQHRGRLFLPFADDDPKTAEVISKVIMLARDQEIQDPNILDQLRS